MPFTSNLLLETALDVKDPSTLSIRNCVCAQTEKKTHVLVYHCKINTFSLHSESKLLSAEI